MSLIDKLYNGELRPCEHEPSDNPEMRRLAERIDKSIDAKDVDELADAYTELIAFTEAEAFTRGFRMGVQMIIDAIKE